MVWLTDREVKGLIIRIVGHSARMNIPLSRSDITLALASLRDFTQFPPLPFEETIHGVSSPEVTGALSALIRTNEVVCHESCKLTELGRLSGETTKRLLESSLGNFGLNLEQLDSALDKTLKSLHQDAGASITN